MSCQAALKSKDPPEINRARAVIKGQITNGIKKLEGIFEKQANGDFDHDNISRTEIVQANTKLDENFQLFQKIHLRYCEFRVLGTNETEEESLVKKDGDYIEEVESKVFPLLDKFTKYDRSFKVFEADEKAKQDAKQAKQDATVKIPELEKNYKRAQEVFQNAKDSATDIVKCLHSVSTEEMLESADIKIQPASSTKQSLSKAFDDLTVKATELSSALESRGDAATNVEEKVKFLYAIALNLI